MTSSRGEAEGRAQWPTARTVIAAVAVIFLLYAGREFFIPIAVAALFSILLRPVVRWLERHSLRPALGATAVMIVALAALGAAGFGLSLPMQSWAAKAPETVAAAQKKLAGLREPMQQLTRTATQLENAGQAPDPGPGASGGPGSQGQGSARTAAAQEPPAQGLQAPTLIARALGTTTSVLADTVTIVLLLWLLLASGDLFYEKLLKLLPATGDKRVASKVVNETESAVAGYLVATALINLGQAAAVSVALWLLGMPNPMLWGVLTFGLEFIPYLGGAIMVGLLTIVAFTTFDSLGRILAAPGAYLAITTLQNNLVSPVVYGQRLRLNPVAVFIGVLLWWSLWGVPGAFLAVPIIATVKVLGDHLPRLRAVGEFLGG